MARPSLKGPFFEKTVVLLLDYDEKGAMGFILNRPTSTLLVEFLPALPALTKRADRVYLGGPVSPNAMAFLKKVHQRPAYQRALERGGPYAYA